MTRKISALIIAALIIAALIVAGVALSRNKRPTIQLVSPIAMPTSKLSIFRDSTTCIARGRLHARVKIEPRGFTGFVSTKGTTLRHTSGYVKDDAFYSAYFKDGILQNDSLVFIASTNRLTDYRPTSEAICSIANIHELRILSLGNINVVSRHTESPFRSYAPN